MNRTPSPPAPGRHVAGNPVSIRATSINFLEALEAQATNAAESVAGRQAAFPSVTVKARNASASAIAAGRACRITGAAFAAAGGTFRRRAGSPLVIDAAAWPGSIDSLAVTVDGIAAGKIGRVTISGWAVADVVEEISGSRCWLHPDGSGRLLTCNAGPFELISGVTVGQKSGIWIGRGGLHLWRYRWTNYAGGEAVLVDPATATDYAAGETEATREIVLSDPLGIVDDQADGDTGYCYEQAGRFYAMQAPCPT